MAASARACRSSLCSSLLSITGPPGSGVRLGSAAWVPRTRQKERGVSEAAAGVPGHPHVI